jgi:two-component system chemotaxis response regulator CheB
MSLGRPIRVLIVDDSAVVRRILRDTLSADPEIEVVGTAVDPYAAQELIAERAPDVMTLDLEMPRMDGLTFLRLLMAEWPLPVIVMSSLTEHNSEYALEALRLGAVDILGKPGSFSIGDLGPQLIAKVKAAVGARLRPVAHEAVPEKLPRAPSPPRPFRAPPEARADRVPPCDPRALILLGASTGGTEALRAVLTALPGDLPPIAIVQHIPALFSKAFARRLNDICALEVREAVDGERLRPGTALIAPGNFHLLVRWSGDHYRARVTDGPAIWHQRPAVDLLFKSAADAGAGPYSVAGLLTGMGRDGAEGLLQLHHRGATTFAQDQATSVVFGMPRAAQECGATDTMLPLWEIAPFLVQRRGPAVPAPTLATHAAP